MQMEAQATGRGNAIGICLRVQSGCRALPTGPTAQRRQARFWRRRPTPTPTILLSSPSYIADRCLCPLTSPDNAVSRKLYIFKKKLIKLRLEVEFFYLS